MTRRCRSTLPSSRPGGDLGAAGSAEALEDVAHVGLDREAADAEPVGDLLVREAAGDERGDALLSSRQVPGIGVRAPGCRRVRWDDGLDSLERLGDSSTGVELSAGAFVPGSILVTEAGIEEGSKLNSFGVGDEREMSVADRSREGCGGSEVAAGGEAGGE